jgi:tetratricopeptide (TPR) repeat protein
MDISKQAPVVTRDPRFRAGRSLVQQGLASDAVRMFATLLEEVTSRYSANIEAAPAYYEYGNALLREALKLKYKEPTEETTEEAAKNARGSADAAAEQRQKQQQQVKEEIKGEEANSVLDKKPAAIPKVEEEYSVKKEEENSGDHNEKSATVPSSESQQEQERRKEDNDDDDDDDDDGNAKEEGSDLNLSLEMMENAFSILDEYRSSTSNIQYKDWVEEQYPRVLLGIGDTLSALERHADAADAYSRALEIRQETLKLFAKEDCTLAHLQAHRKATEATVLIAEELLACLSNEDVVTTETQTLIVKASERVEYARGYYDKARDALQETVYHMGSVAARGIDLSSEKEDVCFIATMVMGVGSSLAEIDEEEVAAAAEANEPMIKKQKT